MEVERGAIDEEAEKDTWYCLQCRRRPYYERSRLDAILRNAERDVQVDWADIEAGASQIPSKMDLSKVSGTTRELFPWNPVCHASPNGSGAPLAAVLETRSTSNQQQAQAQLYADEYRNTTTQSDNTLDISDTTTVAFGATNIDTTGEQADAHQRQTSIMAPHLESESAVSPVVHLISLTHLQQQLRGRLPKMLPLLDQRKHVPSLLSKMAASLPNRNQILPSHPLPSTFPRSQP